MRAVGPRGVCAGAAVILWREKGPRSLLGGQTCLQQEAWWSLESAEGPQEAGWQLRAAPGQPEGVRGRGGGTRECGSTTPRGHAVFRVGSRKGGNSGARDPGNEAGRG